MNAEPAIAGASIGRIILVGNPNVGKSAIFGELTGRYVTVSNYPGTTVEQTLGQANIADHELPILDTPGTNTLIPASDDERVTRTIVIGAAPNDVIVQVGDSKNLRRTLSLTLSLIETGRPLVLVLNMRDEAEDLGIEWDLDRLGELLAVPVISTCAPRGEGIDELREAIWVAQSNPFIPIRYHEDIELYLERHGGGDPRKRFLLINLLCESQGSDSLEEALSEQFSRAFQKELVDDAQLLDASLDGGARFSIHESRDQRARELAAAVRKDGRSPTSAAVRNALGAAATHPIWGWPILAGVLFAMYQVVGVLGAGILVDFMESTVFQTWLNPLAMRAIETMGFPLVERLLVGEFGVITMALTYGIAIVLPIVATFFIFFGILEDSGYLPRLAVMVDRLFRLVGLNGKAVLPMVLGLGCDTMATLTTRILETRKERLIATTLLALGVPCSAQLGVILGVLGALPLTFVLAWALVVIATMGIVGAAAARLLPGDRAPLVLELPPLRIPGARNIIIKTVARIEWYLKEALPIFVYGTLLLFALAELNLLGSIERAFAPIVVGALGLPAEGAQAFLIGFLRRDYGATMFFDMFRNGQLNQAQALISLTCITLFVPCIANFFIIIKEQGVLMALRISALVFTIALVVGSLMNLVLHLVGAA